MEVKISASILNSDMSVLRDEVKKAERAGVSMIHLDIMDGHFVKNITFGDGVVKSLRDKTKLPFDTHLMVKHPKKFIESFANAGSDIITIHYESMDDTLSTLLEIKKHNIKAGISIKPETEIEKVYEYLPFVDMVLIMTVNPGEGGQGFIKETLEKIHILSEYIKENQLKVEIEVDGGINNETAKMVTENGANVLVVGTYLYNAEKFPEMEKRVKLLKLNTVR